MNYTIGEKASIQRAPIRSAKCADSAGRTGDPPYDGELQPLHGRFSPNSGHTTTAFAGGPILWVVTLSLRSVN
jgi:hypothetical protein